MTKKDRAGRQKRKEVRKRTKSGRRSKTHVVTETTYVIKVK